MTETQPQNLAAGFSWRVDDRMERLSGCQKCESPAEAADLAATVRRLAASAEVDVEVRAEGNELLISSLATPRSIVFAQGIVLLEFLTGKCLVS
jgi:hypothetical protein